MNLHCRDKTVATDTIYSDRPDIDDGSTCAELFIGTKSLVSDVYGMKIDNQFLNTLEDNIRARCALSKFVSDNYQSEVINHAHSVILELFIDYLSKLTTLSAPELF